MKKIRLFAFDFDGTLVDTKRDIADCVNLTLAQLDVRTLPRETIYSYIGGGVGPLLARALDKTGVDNIPSAVEIFIKHYDEHLLDHSAFYPNCRETLGGFSGTALTICSNKPLRFIKKILAALGSLEQFPTIVGGDDPAQKKPDPQGLLDILSAHAVCPEEAVMVGDLTPLGAKLLREGGASQLDAVLLAPEGWRQETDAGLLATHGCTQANATCTPLQASSGLLPRLQMRPEPVTIVRG